MNKEILSKAIDNISEGAVAETASARDNAAVKSRRLPKIAIAAAAIALCGAMATAVAAGGGLIDIKNIFGTVTGQEYVGDATDDFKVSVIGFNESGPELAVEKTDPESNLILDGCKIKPLSYTISDANGKTVLASSKNEKTGADLKTAEEWYEAPGSGSYTCSIDGFVIEPKADQPLEINGHWATEFIISFDNGNYTCSITYHTVA